MAVTGFARVQRRDFYVLPRHGGVLEQRRGCCNLVGGGQKPFITKMLAGMSLWSPPRWLCQCRRWRPHRVGPALRRYHRAGRRLYTAPGACSLPPFLTLSPLSPPLCRSLALRRRQRGRGSTRHKAPGTPPTPAPTSHILASSTRLHAQSLLEQAGASRRVNLHPAAPRPTL